MLKTVLTPEKLWPGGIPSSVRLHQDGDLSENDMKEDSKGWCQFVEEEWVPKTDPNEEMQQRRALIERWASADQAFRDFYQKYAPLRDSALDYPPNLLESDFTQKPFICLASVDKEQHAANYKLLIKLLILLYIHDNTGACHPMSYEWCQSPHLPDILIDTSTMSDFTDFFSHRNLLSNLYLHPADFRVLSMTRSGTVIFPDVRPNSRSEEKEHIVIDQDCLNQGRVALMTFKPNGEIRHHAILLPWSLGPIMLFKHNKGWPFNELLDLEHTSYSHPDSNRPLNMDEPLLTIVDSAIQRGDLWYAGYGLADWEDEIEKFAPGYLTLEAQGRAIDYDLAKLWTESLDDYGHSPQEWKIMSRETGHI